MKTCKTCGVDKELTDYYAHTGARDGYRRSCKSCVIAKQLSSRDKEARREYSRQYYLENAEQIKEKVVAYREENREAYLSATRKHSQKMKELLGPELVKYRARGYALKRKYGLSLEQYEELLERQGRCCAICGRHESEFKTNLAVDHSHRSGRVRGALCTGCNYRLVARHEDADLLRKVADYIEQGTEWFVPQKKRRRKTTRKVKDDSTA